MKTFDQKISVGEQPLNISDLLLLRNIAIRSYLDHFIFLWLDEGKWYVDKVYNEERLGEELLDANNEFFLAYSNNSPAGFLKIKKDHAMPGSGSGHGLELEKIYLLKSSVGTGLGRKMMELVLRRASELKKDYVWLKAMDSSVESIAFYEKNGFEQCGTYRLGFEMMKPTYRGMVIMKKRLQ